MVESRAELSASISGLVRPRFLDETFTEDAQPLDVLFDEAVEVDGALRLCIAGPRGSGLTSALRWLAARARARGYSTLEGRWSSGLPLALSRRDPKTLVFIDDSFLDEDGALAGATSLSASPDELGERCVVACSEPSSHLFKAYDFSIVRLAPWSGDDLLEYLDGACGSREETARLWGFFAACPKLGRLLDRPRRARVIIDATRSLDPSQNLTRAAVLANVLDEVPPQIQERLRQGASSHLGALKAAVEAEDQRALRELAAWFDVAEARRDPFLIPGLRDFMGAVEALRSVSRNRPPWPVESGWSDVLGELITKGQRIILRDWLSGRPFRERGDSAAASLLWASGETPRFVARRPYDLREARLCGIDLPGVDLRQSGFSGADLSRARLPGARLEGSTWCEARAPRARFDGADLREGLGVGADFRAGGFDGACLSGARFTGCDFREARFRGAQLVRARLSACMLGGAILDRAQLHGAILEDMDLQAAEADGLSLEEATLRRCTLTDQDWGAVRGPRLRLIECELSGFRMRGADLEGAHLESCPAHGLDLEGADLRGAVFSAVNFHLGSTRAGLLTGRSPMEGRMTGYYDEAQSEEGFLSPEERRHANLRGADLRGARFPDSLLFRVDLREAILDPELRALAREQEAILD